MPCSCDSSFAISGTAAFIFSAAACRNAARLVGGSAAHAGNAFAAASTAALTSAAVPRGIESTTEPFEGFLTSIVLPACASTSSPLMNIRAMRDTSPTATGAHERDFGD